MRRWFMRTGNKLSVALYRASGGRAVGGADKVLLLTVPGRRSGEPRSTCVRYLDGPGGRVVWGAGGGSPRDPDWFLNLRAAGSADVLVGRERHVVAARELVGAERDEVWRGTVLARVPEVARYADRAGRTIPVAVLTVAGARPAGTTPTGSASSP